MPVPPSRNPFMRVLWRAHEKNWCMQPWCTTCGSIEYRKALQRIGRDSASALLEAMASADPVELTALPNWEGAVEIAFHDLPIPRQHSTLLNQWLEPAARDLRTFDVLLYRLVRLLPHGDAVRARWVEQGIGIALEQRDFSLTESLILTLGEDAKLYPELIRLALEIANENPKQMQRVLRNACGIEVDAEKEEQQ